LIVTVTLNPSVDIRFEVDSFRRGEVSRARESEQTAGGKGLNVTRVLQQLKAPVVATGLLGGKPGEFIQEYLESEEIASSFVKISDPTRSCIAILEDGTKTEVLGPGAWIKKEEIEDFYRVFKNLTEKAEIVCISGSLPRGIPSDFYRALIERAQASDCRVLLDTSGKPLVEGLKGCPELVKPNLEELQELLGKNLEKEDELARGLKEIVNSGTQIACLSLGKDGALVFGKEKYFKIRVPRIRVENPVGSGDAMLAGWAYGLLKGFELEKAAIFASACGVSNALQKKTGKVDPSQLEEISRKVKLESKG